MAKARRVVKKLNKIYSSDIDWMGYKLSEENYLTRHHIEKRANSNPTNNKLTNSALLGKISHQILHYLEERYIDIYNLWNELFLLIHDIGMIDDEIIKRIFELKNRTEGLLELDNNLPEWLREKGQINPYFDVFDEELDKIDNLTLQRIKYIRNKKKQKDAYL